MTRHRVWQTVAGSVATRVAPGMPHTVRNSGRNGRGQRSRGTGAGAWATGRATPSIAAVPDQRAMRAGHGSPTGSLSPLPRMRTVSELKNGSTRVASGVDAWPSRRAIVGLHRGSVKARHNAPPACAASALTDPRRSPDRQLRDGHGDVVGEKQSRITLHVRNWKMAVPNSARTMV